MNKKFIVFFIGLATLYGSTAMAGDNWKQNRHHSKSKFIDYAEVVDIEPIYRTVLITVPEKECRPKETHRTTKYRTNNATGNMVLGGIIGGVVGNIVGNRMGRKAGHNKARGIATVAGSIIGATIGHDLAKPTHAQTEKVRYVQNCNTHVRQREEYRLDGYQVTYRYRGEQFTTHMDEKPGRHIKVTVKLTPAHHSKFRIIAP